LTAYAITQSLCQDGINSPDQLLTESSEDIDALVNEFYREMRRLRATKRGDRDQILFVKVKLVDQLTRVVNFRFQLKNNGCNLLIVWLSACLFIGHVLSFRGDGIDIATLNSADDPLRKLHCAMQQNSNCPNRTHRFGHQISAHPKVFFCAQHRCRRSRATSFQYFKNQFKQRCLQHSKGNSLIA
jgi:hypothetical protein